MARPKNENIQISVQCHPNVVKQVREYAKEISEMATILTEFKTKKTKVR